MFNNANILRSFYYCDEFAENIVIPNAKKLLLDSGAFTFFTAGGSVDWQAYIRKYAAFIKKNGIELFFELDIDSLIGYEKVLYYRQMLEDLTGKACIPVWHKSRGLEEYEAMCEKYNYIGIGGIVSKEIPKREYKYFPHMINIAHKHGARVHGLGFTSMKDLPNIHFDSVDSTAWVSGTRFGIIYQFDGKTMIQHARKQGKRVADTKAVTFHNFNEWVKFSHYAEKYL